MLGLLWSLGVCGVEEAKANSDILLFHIPPLYLSGAASRTTPQSDDPRNDGDDKTDCSDSKENDSDVKLRSVHSGA